MLFRSTVKELFHASAEGRRAHMVSVIGIAGIGKSRLSWEFFKYVDGLADQVYWHRGRCLAYGDGVTYWALAEIVRGRAGIVEGEDPASARAKLRRTIEEFLAEPEERAWVDARLAQLLALEERTAPDPEDLFGAWRRFFERMAEHDPVALVFEDLQWADPSLLDFIEYLLNWSRGHPIFVMALARPEVAERFPQWAAARRGVSTMYLEPLEREDMERLLDGLVPGLPEAVRGQILDRAEGVPLYAMETVRMLLDRGLVVQDESAYRLAGPIEDLAIPETLHALIAARLDGLPAESRSLLQDAAVIGKTFSVPVLAAVSGRDTQLIEPDLQSLVRKEVLGIQADPRSPERGQYVFLQDLVRRVAYETLSRRDRKVRHLAVAGFLDQQRGGDEIEIIEVLAAHHLEAYRAAPDAPDAPSIKAHAREALIRAATRSESLAARRAALGYFEQAIELTEVPAERVELFARAGQMAFDAGLVDRGRELFDAGIDIARRSGDDLAEARIEMKRAFMATADGRLEESLERLTRAYDVLAKHPPGADLAEAAAEKARLVYFVGRPKEAMEAIEVALPIAEDLFLPEVLAQALNTKSLIMRTQGRVQEAIALLRHALRFALEHEATGAALRAYNNLASVLWVESAPAEELQLIDDGLALARRMGHKGWETKFLSNRVPNLVWLGRWDEAIAAAEEAQLDAETANLAAMTMERIVMALPYAVRLQFEEAEAALSEEIMEASDDIQAVLQLGVMRAYVRFYQGRHEEAVTSAELAIGRREQVGATGGVDVAYALAVDAALAMEDLERASRLLAGMETIRPGELSPYASAEMSRVSAKLDAARGGDVGVQARFEEAVAGFRSIGMRYHLGVALAEYGQWLAAQGRHQEAAGPLSEASAIFEDLRASWWLDRLGVVEPRHAEAT